MGSDCISVVDDIDMSDEVLALVGCTLVSDVKFCILILLSNGTNVSVKID